MKYKVCILAAGVGSRMEPFTQHINKSLLPVDLKASISHIIEKFDADMEFVIAVGHLKETVIEYLECAHGERKITLVEVDKISGKGSGPGYSLMQCRNHLDSPFIFFASDTLVFEDIPPPIENWLGVSPVVDTKEYCTVEMENDAVISLDDKIISNNKDAFVGVAGVRDYRVFFDSLEKDTELKNEELQVSNGFNALIDFNLSVYHFTWHDTGNMKGYIKANKVMSDSDHAFDFSKSDEFLYFVGDKVIKYFKDKSIVRNRYKRSKILKDLCPKIECIKDSFYSYKKQDGRVLYDVINDRIMCDLIDWLDTSLWNKEKIVDYELNSFKAACFDFYYKKTLSRLNNYHSKHKIKDQATYINEIKVPTIEKMLDSINWEYMSNGIASNFHGDLQFDNILLKDDGKFLLLDWRQDFSRIINYGDQYYDLAKLNGGIQVSYKLIKLNKFLFHKDSLHRITIKHDIPIELVRSRKIFNSFLKNKGLDATKVDILTSLIYLNMSPMHHEPFDHFMYNYGKLSLYKALVKQGKIDDK
jgi:NDP-sugar pyrophosphorylase family protein